MEKNLRKNRSICSNCGGSFGYVRIKTKEFQCRDCGSITVLKEEKKEKDGEC